MISEHQPGASALYIRREDRGHLRLTGTDRLSYLHGLLSNDVATLTAGSSRYAALLTAQGRMITDMFVHEVGDAAIIELDRTLAPSIREHLERFVITEDVTVEDATASVVQFGVYGPHAEALVDGLAADAVAASWPSADSGLQGTEVLVAASAVAEVERTLADHGATRIDPRVLEIARIEAGIPKFLVDMDTTTIPLEAGIEDRAISMTKGCYVGQEVIVRVLHRGGGRVAKKLVGLRTASPVSRDDRLWSGEREIGRITSAVESPRFGPIALGYVQRDFVEPGTELTVQRNGTNVTAVVAPVPFVRPT
jgi:folate-binding protein YgfZ